MRKIENGGNFEKWCSTLSFLAHVRSFRPPASSISGPELVPGRPRPELRNVYFPRGCARPRPRAPARARARVPQIPCSQWQGGEEGVSVPPLSQTLSKENSIPTYQRYVGMLKSRFSLGFGTGLNPPPLISGTPRRAQACGAGALNLPPGLKPPTSLTPPPAGRGNGGGGGPAPPLAPSPVGSSFSG